MVRTRNCNYTGSTEAEPGDSISVSAETEILNGDTAPYEYTLSLLVDGEVIASKNGSITKTTKGDDSISGTWTAPDEDMTVGVTVEVTSETKQETEEEEGDSGGGGGGSEPRDTSGGAGRGPSGGGGGGGGGGYGSVPSVGGGGGGGGGGDDDDDDDEPSGGGGGGYGSLPSVGVGFPLGARRESKTAFVPGVGVGEVHRDKVIFTDNRYRGRPPMRRNERDRGRL